MRTKTDDNESDIVVGIDNDRNSQHALKWAADNLVGRRRHITLLHVQPKTSTIITSSGSHLALCEVNEEVAKAFKSTAESIVKETFEPFKVFCTRKNIHVNEVALEDHDIVTALCNYVKVNSTSHLVLGAHTKNYFSSLSLFKSSDVPGSVIKEAPEFCNVYVINKGKVASIRHGVGVPPPSSETPRRPSSYSSPNLSSPGTKFGGSKQNQSSSTRGNISSPKITESPFIVDNVAPRSYFDTSSLRSNKVASRSHCGPSSVQSKASSISSNDSNESFYTSHLSNYSYQDCRISPNSTLTNFSSHATTNISKFSSYSSESSEGSVPSSDYMDDLDVEMRRLKEEMKQKMAMYDTACKDTETLTARHKALKGEKAIEAPKSRKNIAKKGKMKKVHNVVADADVRYHIYTIEEIEVATDNFSSTKKIGEGGYGPVYKSYLDHTPAAIKVIYPDTVHGTSQFHREVEVLSNIRHPNMVNLIGACPEKGCLVYEYMENGTLDDCLLGRGNNQALSWQARFRISAEIATALLFLHQSKPEALVHRNLKPGNILLDRNYVSKISDVGLSRLVPPYIADTETTNNITKASGTLSYIDPEYQLTGMLGTKSDVYSFGIVLLRMITGKSSTGLTHQVESAIKTGTLSEVLDPAVPDWPVEAALNFAKIALNCAKLRRQDRPNLAAVLPELNRLRDLAQESMPHC